MCSKIVSAIIAISIIVASNPAQTSKEISNNIAQKLDGKESINGQIKFGSKNDSGQFGLVAIDKVTFPDRREGGKPQKKTWRKLKTRRQQGSPVGYSGQAAYQLPQQQQQQDPTKLRPLQGPMAVMQDVLDSLYTNDDRACILRMLCTEAFKYKHGEKEKGDKSYTELIDALKAIITNAPQITQLTGYDTSKLLHSAQEFLKPVNIGSAVSNSEACYAEYPNCPKSALDFAEYIIHNKGGFEHFFKGKDYQYTVDNINRKLNLDVKYTNLSSILHPSPEPTMNWDTPPTPPTYQQQPNLDDQNPYQQNAFLRSPYAQAPYQPDQYQQNQYQPNQYQPNEYQSNQYQPNQYQYQAYRRGFPYKNNIYSYKQNVIPNIQQRIQNSPVVYIGNDYNYRVGNNEIAPTWFFPKNEQYFDQRPREGPHLKFPDQDSVSRDQKPYKGFLFPEVTSNFLYDAGGVEEELGGLAKGGDVVYVMRDGNPNRPIVYRLRKGETMNLRKRTNVL